MSAAHTEGRLNYMVKGRDFAAGGVRYCRLVVEPAFGVTKIAEVATSVLEPNARRLAACWNACEGSKTEDLEELGADYIKPLIKLIDECAAARALLSDALETFDNNPREDHEVADRIRAFLKGGAA